MLIDAFADDWIELLVARAADLTPSKHLYILLDGAFVPGLHKILAADRKALMFASLPGCTEQTEDVSPFIFLFLPADKNLRALLRRCERWPMVSAIETSETLQGLANRLSAWCVVEADGQRFNFRFTDTRRLPAIFGTLKPEQRAWITGPAGRWSFIGRGGRWLNLDVISSSEGLATGPKLRYPSKAYALVNAAVHTASKAKLNEQHLVDWCEWLWVNGQSLDNTAAALALATWRNTYE